MKAMKQNEIIPRGWYLIKGTPRPVTGSRKHYAFSYPSTINTASRKYSLCDVEPLEINKEIINCSNLRSLKENKNVYDSLHVKTNNVKLPFTIRFNYEEEDPCIIEFEDGHIIKIKHVHKLQQFIYVLSGEELTIKMNF